MYEQIKLDESDCSHSTLNSHTAMGTKTQKDIMVNNNFFKDKNLLPLFVLYGPYPLFLYLQVQS